MVIKKDKFKEDAKDSGNIISNAQDITNPFKTKVWKTARLRFSGLLK